MVSIAYSECKLAVGDLRRGVLLWSSIQLGTYVATICARSRDHTTPLQSPLSQLSLLTSPTAVSGAFLWYDGARLSGSSLSLTLTVGEMERVFCFSGSDSASVPTSIRWYNPQGHSVSWNFHDEVNQFVGTSGMINLLTFQSYQPCQGGQYECRVVGPGNNTEKLSVTIGECYIWVVVAGL